MNFVKLFISAFSRKPVNHHTKLAVTEQPLFYFFYYLHWWLWKEKFSYSIFYYRTWTGFLPVVFNSRVKQKLHSCKKYCRRLRAYSKTSTGATIGPNLESLVLKKVFSLEMVKNDIFLCVEANEVPFKVPKKYSPKIPFIPLGPGSIWMDILTS